MINIKISNLTQKRFPSKVYIVCRQQIWNRLFKLGCHQRYQHQLQFHSKIYIICRNIIQQRISTCVTASKYGTTSNIKFQYAAAAWRTKTNLSSYLLSSNHGRFQCVCDICCSSKFQCRQPLFYEQRNTFFYDLQT